MGFAAFGLMTAVGSAEVTHAERTSPETSRWYAGATLSSLRVDADEVHPGGSSSVGGVVGLHLTRVVSLELEMGHGLGELSRVYSGPFLSFAGEGATREEIERLAVTVQRDTRWKPALTWSALVVLRSAERRVGIAAFAGLTGTRYDRIVTHAVLHIPAEVDATAAEILGMMGGGTPSWTRGGVSGGLMLPIAVTRRVRIAPEVRYTFGSFGDEKYNVFRAGARVVWEF